MIRESFKEDSFKRSSTPFRFVHTRHIHTHTHTHGHRTRVIAFKLLSLIIHTIALISVVFSNAVISLNIVVIVYYR